MYKDIDKVNKVKLDNFHDSIRLDKVVNACAVYLMRNEIKNLDQMTSGYEKKTDEEVKENKFKILVNLSTMIRDCHEKMSLFCEKWNIPRI